MNNPEKLDLHSEDVSEQKRRENENCKIECGRAHFKALNVNFDVATDIRKVLTR